MDRDFDRVVSFRMTKVERDELLADASKSGKTLSDYLRDLVLSRFKNELTWLDSLWKLLVG